MKISVIVNTYNQPQALAVALYSLLRQSETDFEVVIADDGSREDTWKLIARFQKLFGKRLSHQWQADTGYRRSMILNRAFEVCRATHAVIIEENSFVHRHFVRDHLSVTRRCDMFSGSKVLLSPEISDFVIENPSRIDTLEFWRKALFSKTEENPTRHLGEGLRLPTPLGNLTAKPVSDVRTRRLTRFNLSVAKSWVEAVGGFDQNITDPGAELRDFYRRMQDAGAMIRSSRNYAVQWCMELGDRLPSSSHHGILAVDP